MKVKRFVFLGLTQWVNEPQFSYLPIELFKTHNIPEGFRVGKISEVFVKSNKSTFGSSPVFKTPNEAISWAKSELTREGKTGKFALFNNGEWFFLEI